MPDKFIVVDLGGTSVRVALCGSQGDFIVEPLPDITDEKILDLLDLRIQQLLADNENIEAIGVATPGPMDTTTGTILEKGNLPDEIVNYPLKKHLKDKFKVPVFFGNDAQMAALGEHRFGAGRGFKNMIYMGIGTGIGGGIIINGNLYRGRNDFAGEIGQHQFLDLEHIEREPQKLEDIASGKAIGKRAIEAVKKQIDRGQTSRILELANGNLGKINSKNVAEAAREGDQLAKDIFNFAGICIGISLKNFMHALAPDGIVLGGGVMNAGDLLLPPIVETIKNRETGFPPMIDDVVIVKSENGDKSGLLGVLALILGSV